MDTTIVFSGNEHNDYSSCRLVPPCVETLEQGGAAGAAALLTFTNRGMRGAKIPFHLKNYLLYLGRRKHDEWKLKRLCFGKIFYYASLQKLPFTKICPPLPSHRSGIPAQVHISRALRMLPDINLHLQN